MRGTVFRNDLMREMRPQRRTLLEEGCSQEIWYPLRVRLFQRQEALWSEPARGGTHSEQSQQEYGAHRSGLTRGNTLQSETSHPDKSQKERPRKEKGRSLRAGSLIRGVARGRVRALSAPERFNLS